MPKLRERLKSIFHIGSRKTFGTKPESSQEDIYHPVPVSWCQPDSHPLASKDLSQASFKLADPISGSRLLSRLPLEIRREIYNYVLGNHKIIHLIRAPGKIVQSSNHKSKAVVRSPDKIVHSSTRQKQDQKCTSAWFDCYFQKIDLALLRTCRQIYVETIDIVYGSNLFDFEEPADLALFADQCLPPQRFAAIRHLRFQGRHVTCESDQPTWSQFWHLIATRMNLTDLRISLDFFCTAAYMGMETFEEVFSMDALWVQPMLEVKGLKACRIELLTCPCGSQEQIDFLIDNIRASLMAGE